MNAKLECYGGMFPDLSTGKFNTLLKGKVFEAVVKRSGFAITERNTSVDLTEWDRCTQCPSYPDCFRLSMGKLVLHGVTQDYGLARAI